MVVDVGGGTTETAVISLGGVVASHAIRCGGFDMDAAIQHYVRHEHGIAIGERTGEELKLAIGSALPYADEVKAEVRGREITTGLPKTVVLSPEEVRYALRDLVDLIVATVVGCLAESPPELAQDIIYEGIHLVGGGAMLRGWPTGWPTRPRFRSTWWRRRSNVWCRAPALPRLLRQPPADLRRRRELSGAGASLHREQVLRHLADLPVAIVQATSQGGIDGGPRERSQRHRGAPADGRLVLEAGQDGRQSPGVADGPEGGHRRFAAQWVGVARLGRGQRRRGKAPPTAPAVRRATMRPSPPPRRHRRPERSRCRRRGSPWQLAGAPTDPRGRVGQCRAHVRPVSAPSRSSAPRAVARTVAASIDRAARATGSSPTWPASATARRVR